MNVPVPTPAENAEQSTPPRSGPRPDKAELDRIFGVTPLSSRDDLADPELPRSADQWYLENRPPHHDK